MLCYAWVSSPYKVHTSNSRLYPTVRNFHNIVFISSKWKNKVCPIICVNLDQIFSMVLNIVEKVLIKIDTNYCANVIFGFDEMKTIPWKFQTMGTVWNLMHAPSLATKRLIRKATFGRECYQKGSYIFLWEVISLHWRICKQRDQDISGRPLSKKWYVSIRNTDNGPEGHWPQSMGRFRLGKKTDAISMISI